MLFGKSKERSFYDKKITVFLQANFGYVPRNFEVYRRAFRHKSFAGKNSKSNERLEFLGDTVLNTIISDCLFKKFSEKEEGFLTRLRSRLVSRNHLGQLSEKIGLTSVLKSKMSESDQKSTAAGNAFEALVGAMYLDRGYEFTQLKITKLFLPIIENIDFEDIQDYKSRVMEWGQKEKKEIAFEVISEEGAEHEKVFEVALVVDGNQVTTGKGKNKKSAEQVASLNFYESRFN